MLSIVSEGEKEMKSTEITAIQKVAQRRQVLQTAKEVVDKDISDNLPRMISGQKGISYAFSDASKPDNKVISADESVENQVQEA